MTPSALETMAALLACNAISVILLQYQIGRFLKREQLRYWIAGGTSLFIVGLIGFSLADSLVSWCVAMFIFTLGEMIIYPAEFLFVDTLAPEELRGSYYGAQNLAALGGALSSVICGFLLMHTPAPTMFYALSALTAIGRVPVFHEWSPNRLTAKIMHSNCIYMNLSASGMNGTLCPVPPPIVGTPSKAFWVSQLSLFFA